MQYTERISFTDMGEKALINALIKGVSQNHQ